MSWNVNITGSASDVGQIIREAVSADAGPDQQRQAMIFGKYLSQLASAFEGNTWDVHTNGTFSEDGVQSVMFTCKVTP